LELTLKLSATQYRNPAPTTTPIAELVMEVYLGRANIIMMLQKKKSSFDMFLRMVKCVMAKVIKRTYSNDVNCLILLHGNSTFGSNYGYEQQGDIVNRGVIWEVG
jgi:hypothetical protein